MDSESDLPCLMPFSVAGCGLLQQGVSHCNNATEVALLQVVDNWRQKECMSSILLSWPYNFFYNHAEAAWGTHYGT